MTSIVIPTHQHCSDLLQPCLESIIKYTDLSDVEVIIVANGCTDNTREYVEGLGKPFKLVWIEEPYGYTKSTNVGIQHSTGEYIVLLNNDTILMHQDRHSWINILKAPFLSMQNVGVTGPAMQWEKSIEVYFLVFFCVMISREALNKVGYLDEIFNPGFCEDVDFCVRAERAGYKILQVPTSEPLRRGVGTIMNGYFPIVHTGEKTIGDNVEKYDKLMNRNINILKEKYPINLEMINKTEIKNSIKLNLGSGDTRFPGFINVDLYHENADIKADVSELPYKDEEVDEMVAYHIVEHISPYKLLDTLKEWYRVLKPSGKLAIEMPDILELCRNFVDADLDGDYGKWRILNCIFGTTQIEHPHVFGWYFELIKPLFEQAGFINITKQPTQLNHWGYNFRMECQKINNSINSNTNLPVLENRKVYDCFMFANELDVLEIRLNELKDVVDKFVIVESPITHSGLYKPLYFNQNMDRFKEFKDKIIHIIVDDMPVGNIDPWIRERMQRDAIKRGLIDLKDDDIIIISDADEIPRAETIKNYRKEQRIMIFEQNFSYYFVNYVAVGKWNKGHILPYSIFKNMTPNDVRSCNVPKIKNGGWHFSYLGGVDKIIEKLSWFAHQEYNNDTIKNKEKILKCMETGVSIFGNGDTVFIAEPISSSYPQYIRDNIDKFKHLIFEPKIQSTIKVINLSEV